MSTTTGLPDIDFGGPAAYCIVVQGFLDAEWSDRLAGMTISTTTGDETHGPRTTLVGRIRDQAELNGVLETLYGLHLSILEVKQVEDDDQQQELS